MSKNQGLLSVIAAVAIQLTIGTAYIWSMFQTGIADTLFGGDNAAAGLTFSILLGILTIATVFSGKLAAKYSIRTVIFAGGIILSLGFFLASFVTADAPWLLWVTYGFMGGVGMGFTYSTTIACAQKWYPHKKGFVTGVIVSALGFGGVVFTFAVEGLIEAFGGVGYGELSTFRVLAAAFLIICSVGSIFMKTPPEGYVPAGANSAGAVKGPSKWKAANHAPREMLKTPHFYLITIAFTLACMGGLMMINFARPIAEMKGLGEAATVAVFVLSVFNSVGRLVWGAVSDRLGRRNTIIVLLLGAAILSLLVNAAEGFWVFVLVGFIGFFFGGLLSTFPALVADSFGIKHIATNYGFVLLGFGLSAVVASQIAGAFSNHAAGDISLMFPAFIIASVCALVGVILMLVLKKIRRTRSSDQV